MPVAISRWQTPPQHLRLSDTQVDLWRYKLDLEIAEIRQLKNYLSDDEVTRAQRLLLPEKQQQYVVARACLRIILSRYLTCKPTSLSFCYGPHGKPSLADLSSRLQFNLSHSGDWALLAVTRGAEIGVDIEQVDPQLDFQPLARNYFSRSEINSLENVCEVRRRRTFYRLWTSKESNLKRCGAGFSGATEHDQMVQIPCYKILPITKNSLAAISYSQDITSINRYELTEI